MLNYKLVFLNGFLIVIHDLCETLKMY